MSCNVKSFALILRNFILLFDNVTSIQINSNNYTSSLQAQLEQQYTFANDIRLILKYISCSIG